MIIVDLRRKGGQGRWVNMSQIPGSSLRQEKVCNEEAPKREFLATFFSRSNIGLVVTRRHGYWIQLFFIVW